MSAQSLEVLTLDLPNPTYDPDTTGPGYHRVPANSSYTYSLPTNIRTLSNNAVNPGADVTGLLYTPDLDHSDPCYNASKPYVPANVTRQATLPATDYDLIAIAPWLSPACVQSYLASARQDPIRGFLFFLPQDNETGIPPLPNSPVWSLGDGGSWKRQNDYPVYAIPGAVAQTLMAASALYSGNMTDVPFGHQLTEMYDSRDYVRLFIDINTAGAEGSLPSLWIFLLIVLGILLGIIGLTSLLMHWLQRRRRATLRRQVANGEVDLEALGIKRLTVPQAMLDKMPLYTYGSGAPVAPPAAARDGGAAEAEANKLGSANSSRAGSPLPTTRPTAARSTSFRPTPLQQPTCAICLDDFVAATPASTAATAPENTETSVAATEGTIVRELPCHHIFHPECVDTFLRDNSSLCPMCKKSALPKGYCPTVVTNAMVRRERLVRRMRERGSPTPVVDVERVEGEDGVAPLRSSRIRNFSGALGQLRGMSWGGGGRRISSAPTPSYSQTMTDLTPSSPAQPALVRSNTASSSPVRRVQPPSTPGRREWARQRAVTMLGRRAPVDPDEVEQATTPGWRKIVRGVFPSSGR